MGGFGAPAAATSGFGAFGAANSFAKPATSGFGGFGATNNVAPLGGGLGMGGQFTGL